MPAVVHELIPIDMLRVNESARIAEVHGPQPLVQRLEELGLREGTVIRLVKTGEPLLLAVNGHRLSFRADSSTMIFVEPISVEQARSS
ncbi:MAG: ferrous iron transport protein A [Planctomycetaceae bacterium]|nr:ferrous iron transport protein A [Planctomycetaceae bacterium]